MEGAWEAMSRILIQQEDERQLDTIRARVIEQSIWRQGRRIAHGMQTKGSRECQNRRKCTEVREDVQRVGNQVAEVGFKYFCLDYVSKNGVSVTECNNQGQHGSPQQAPVPLGTPQTCPDHGLPLLGMTCRRNPHHFWPFRTLRHFLEQRKDFRTKEVQP